MMINMAQQFPLHSSYRIGRLLIALLFGVGLFMAHTVSRTSFVQAASKNAASLSNPSWWNGTCDSYSNPNYNPNSSTNITGKEKGNWNGLQACYPFQPNGAMPLKSDGSIAQPDFYTNIPGSNSNVLAWECVELSTRYLYLLSNGILKPVGSNGSAVVDNYYTTYSSSVSGLSKNAATVRSDTYVYLTSGVLPQVGDVFSLLWHGQNPSDPGHTGIVTSININSSGTGTIGVFQQNVTNGSSAYPSGLLHVANWRVGDEVSSNNSLQMFKWLHFNTNQNPPAPDGWMVNHTGYGSVIDGWACDDANGASISRIDVYANGPYNGGGTYLGTTYATLARPDLPPAGKCGYTANHGFRFDTSSAGTGYHSIWVYNILMVDPKNNNTVYYTGLLGNSGNVSVTYYPSFSTSLESGQSQPTWTNSVDTGNGNLSNVGGYCCGLSSPELGTRNETTHSGSVALMYSGMDNSSSSSYAYMKVFDLSSQSITVGANTTLSYWIYPQSSSQATHASGNNSSCVGIDIIFSDGSTLRDSGVLNINNVRAHPAYQCGTLTLDSWNHVTVELGPLSGKTINRLDIAYDQPSNTGGYRGYVDDISIAN